jgi:hypothetical protein
MDWSKIDAALEKRAPSLWWRDDDAVADTPALHRLMALAESVEAPLTLAVIPGNLSDSLAKAIEGRIVTTAVHGWTHTNHAPSSEKKAEFRAHRPQTILLEEAQKGKAILDDAFGVQSLPIFVPPWNRIAPDLPLSECGFTGISVFGEREITAEHNLKRFDSHIDPIDWRGSRSAVPMQQILDQISELLTSEAPIGLMTHHLVHDEAIWAVCRDLVTRLTRAGATWMSARDLLTRAPD